MIVKITFSHKDKKLSYSDTIIDATCDVRTLKNGRRGKNQVVYSIPSGRPYDPDIFPCGEFDVFEPVMRSDEYKKPFFIPTNAKRIVKVWHMDANKNYDAETTETVVDEGYGLHYSSSNTTLGCIKIMQLNDLLNLKDWVSQQLKAKNKVRLEVI
jgi:hypothetical protein